MTEDYRDPEVLRRLYEDEGLTQREMAAALHVSLVTVSRFFRLAGIKARPSGPARGSGRKPSRLISVGGELLTVKQISQQAGVSITTIRNRLSKGAGPELLLAGPQKRGRPKKC